MDDFLERQRQYQAKRKKADMNICSVETEMRKTEIKKVVSINVMENDNQRAIDVIDKAPTIIQDIHTRFEKATELKGKDITFLFAAAAIQTARWALLPRMDWNFSKIESDDRLTAAAGGKLEDNAVLQYLKKDGFSDKEIKKLLEQNHINNYTWQKLLIAPVPYDAMIGSARIDISGVSEMGKNLYGKNHHSATWGHDPIFGWFFGSLNILTRTITFRDFQTYHVAQIDDTNIQKITYKSSLGVAIPRAIKLCSEDSKKLFVSVAKQGMHLKSDKYTKLGLPIPFLSPEKAQELLLKGWNSNEMERLFKKATKNIAVIGAQFGLALIIDNIVRALHLLYYDKSTDGSPDLYRIKTNKIICYSNALAEITNGIYAAATRDIGRLDIGGYINFAKNLITNIKLQNQVKAEFLEKELSKNLVYNEIYYWEEL